MKQHLPTKTDLCALLDEAGLRPDKRLGQNFLIDGNLMRLLVSEADLGRSDVVLEVGAAVGNLTELLASQAGWVVAVELDAALGQIGRLRLAKQKNVDYVVADILAGKHHISPDALGRIAQRQRETGGLVKLVANLPYGAATPLLAELVMSDAPPERLVFTVQEEVALRLSAARGTRAYGPVGVVVQALAEVELLRPLPPTVFWPQPQVNSSMVRLRPQPALRGRIADLGVFRRTVEGLFAHRRKRAARSLSLADAESRPTDFWESRLRAAGLSPAARGEMFSVEEIVRLANVVAAEGPKEGA